MNIFGIGLPEMAVIAAIGLLVFGPKRLPELGKTLGRTLKGFQTASQDFEKEFRTAISPAESDQVVESAANSEDSARAINPVQAAVTPEVVSEPQSASNDSSAA